MHHKNTLDRLSATQLQPSPVKGKTRIHLFTLVQHSGFGVAGKPQFRHAVEEARLSTQAEVNRVRKAGGLILDDYAQASDRAELENYPPSVMGLVPRASGSFARATINGLRIYLPRHSKET